MSGEEAGLNVGKEAEGDFFVEEGMGQFVLFFLLPGLENDLSGIVSEGDGSGFLDMEIIGGDLLSVDEGEGKAVGEDGAKFFHEVEGEGGASGTGLVEETGLRVESAAFASGSAVVGEHGVEEGEQGIGAVERRSLGSAFDAKFG